MEPKAQIKNLPVYEPGKPLEEVKKDLGLNEVIKLASNENPFGSSPRVQEALQKEMESLSVYPDGVSFQLRKRLAQFYDLDPQQFVFGSGSDEIIQLICRAYIKEGTNTVMATPTFPIYKTNAVIEGGEAIEIPLNDGVHDLEAMANAINEQTKIVWVCNPNNPSGTYNNATEIKQFLDQVPEDVLVVLDEAYFEYVTAEDYPQSFELLDQYPNIMILRTFSKIYGLASLRIGYGIASPEINDHLNRVRGPFNTNQFAQVAALAAIEDQDFVQECRQKNAHGLQQLYRAFDELNMSYYPSQANFVLVNVNQNSEDVFNFLMQQGIIVRSGVALGFPNSIRLTVGSSEQNQKVIDQLQQLDIKGAS